MDKKSAVLDQLSIIIDPDLGRDIVSLGFIKGLEIDDENRVAFSIELTTPACPVKDEFKRQAEQAVKKLEWVADVLVTMTAQKRPAAQTQVKSGLKDVNAIIGVSSCKGGVGKSTVAVNLAYTLAKTGAKVGIFDADVYGPSLDRLVKLPIEALSLDDNQMIRPKEHHGVKLMSFAYTQDPRDAGPAIMRGPMVTQVINQLLMGTDWGELDYLIIDMPPGTGDIHITLAQVISMTAAVIVTTPQELSLADVIKGIQMFDSLKVPTVGVIENMSYLLCGECDTKHRPFGQGARAILEKQYGFANTVELPIDPAINTACEHGVPLVATESDSELAKSLQTACDQLVRQVATIQHQGLTKPTLGFDHTRGVILTDQADESVIDSKELRLSCQCAHCVDEFTNKVMIVADEVPDDVRPADIHPVGNYAVGISWSDGHQSLYPYQILRDLALSHTKAAT